MKPFALGALVGVVSALALLSILGARHECPPPQKDDVERLVEAMKRNTADMEANMRVAAGVTAEAHNAAQAAKRLAEAVEARALLPHPEDGR